MRIVYFLIPFLILGCSTKEFIPKTAKNLNLKNKEHKELIDYTKKSDTFRELELKYVKPTSFIDDGVRGEYVYYDSKNHRLGKFKKLNKDLAAKENKLLLIKEKKIISLPSLIYLANRNKNLIAIVFEDDSYGLYDLNKNKLIFYKKDDDVIGARYLGAFPVFYNNLIFFPLLDGKVGVVDKNGNFIRNIDVSDESIVDNIIYLKVIKDNLFMATPEKLILFNPNFLIDYKTSIKHIINDKNYIYIFAVDGKVVKLNTDLKKIKEIDFPFASFFNPSVCKGDIYTLTHSGYLIKLTPDLNYTVYKVKGLNPYFPLKLDGCRIYNQDKVFFIE